MKDFSKIDLHMHTTVSDGTDTPAQILQRVREAGITLFSVTDHDAVKGGQEIIRLLREGDPAFLVGTELSCKDEDGKYHILGYGYDPDGADIIRTLGISHGYRMTKLKKRLNHLDEEYGFGFPRKEIDKLYAMDNPGKPHIGNLMVKYGYVKTKEEGIREYINKLHIKGEYIRPETAIEAILKSGGIPVLAHPTYGSGDQLILGEDMDQRLRKLIAYGLQGVEAFYSGFSDKLIREMLSFAEKYDLYVTAGSDYHGTNKIVVLGDTNLSEGSAYPEGMKRFLQEAEEKMY